MKIEIQSNKITGFPDGLYYMIDGKWYKLFEMKIEYIVDFIFSDEVYYDYEKLKSFYLEIYYSMLMIHDREFLKENILHKLHIFYKFKDNNVAFIVDERHGCFSTIENFLSIIKD